MRKLILLFSLAASLSAAPALVTGQKNTCYKASGTSVTCAVPSDLTAGNDYIVSFSISGSTLSSVSNTVDTFTGQCVTSPRISCTYRAHGVAGGASGKTITITTAASSYTSMTVAEFSGMTALSSASTITSAAGATSPLSCGTVTASTDDLIIMAVTDSTTGSAFTAGAGYTKLSTDVCTGTPQCFANAFQAVASGGSFSPTWTQTTVGANTTCSTVVFQAPAAAATVRHRVNP